MAEISASEVMKLRKISGQGMMDCKKSLKEADGDIDKAMELLRKKGLATLSKRAEREASEGLVVGDISEDGKTGILASLCCETDFVARSEDFVSASKLLLDYARESSSDEGSESILEAAIEGKKFSTVLTDTVSKTGEKMEIGNYQRYKVDGCGLLKIYIHFNGKVGSMVEIETDKDEVAGSESVQQAANDIAMHITATKPLSLDKNEIDTETLEQEKAIFAEQFSGKPEKVVEKIVEGKMKKFYEENCLLEQAFVKDDSKSIAEVISQVGKEADGEAKIKRFVRFEVG